jgi:3-oxoacyl-(acyl-carrier-protein) synthase
VLEELDHARNRGAQIYAEITGYGATCDAYHRVRLAEDGKEPARAIQLALKDSGHEPKDIDYVNLHGTSTLLNDRIETSALKLAFDGYAARIPMSGTKSQIGHPQGASGAAGVAAALCAMHTNKIPSDN